MTLLGTTKGGRRVAKGLGFRVLSRKAFLQIYRRFILFVLSHSVRFYRGGGGRERVLKEGRSLVLFGVVGLGFENPKP